MSPARHRFASLVVLLLGLTPLANAGCSALIQPDPTRLGGTDAPSIDGGMTDTPGLDGGRDAGSDGSIDGGGPDAWLPECTADGQCDDDVPCTTDGCEAGMCSHTTVDSACEAGERCNAVLGCVPILCESNAECQDPDRCNGAETCNPGGAGADPRTGCVAGTPLVCNDGLSCTDDHCDATMGCTTVAIDARCEDGVSCTIDRCSATAGPSGCENLPSNDVCNAACTTGATCNVSTGCMGGAPRACGDGTDCTVDSCDPSVVGFCVNDPLDADGDGAPAQRTPGGMTCAGGTDCDDTLGTVGPGMPEVCANGRDDNCNGAIDEGCATDPDDCAGAVAIPLTGTGTRTGMVTGTFGAFDPDYPACSGTGRDAVYYIDLAGNSDVRIDTVGSAVTDTVLGVATTCSGANFAAACNDDQDPSGSGGTAVLTSRIWLHHTGPGSVGSTTRVYILVKAYRGDATGAFQLNVQVTAPRGDSCGTTAGPLDITGGGLVVGNLAGIGATGERGSCDPDRSSARSEAIFRFESPADGQVWSLQARSTSFRPLLYTRGPGTSSCSSAGSETSCDGSDASGFAEVTNVTVMTGRSNYAIVDNGAFGNAYTLAYDP
jgi:hypothetical protein